METDEALSKIGQGSAIVVSGVLVGMVFQYFVKILLARYLGPGQFGVFMQALTLTQSAVIVSLLGVHKGLPRLVSHSETGDVDRDLLSSAFYLVLPSAALMSAAVFLSSDYIATAFFNDPALLTPLRIFALGIVPLALIYLFMSIFRGFKNAKYKIYLDDFVFSGLVLVFSVAFVLRGWEVPGAAYGYLAAEIVSVCVALYLYRKLEPQGLFSIGKTRFRRLMVFSWPLFVISVLLIVNRWMSIWILGYFRDSALVGIYSAAFSVAGLLAFILSSLGYMFMPVVSELHAKGKNSRIREVYSNVTRWVTAAALPVFAGMLIFPQEILGLLYGSSYVEGANLLRVLSIGYFYMAFTGPSGEALLSAGKTKLQMTGIALVIAFSGVLNVLLVPEHGALGAAISTVAGLLLGNTFLLLAASRCFGGKPYNKLYARIITSVLVSSAAVYALKLALNPGLYLSVVLGGVLVSIYFALMWLIDGLRKEEKETLLSLFSRFRPL